MIESRQYKYKYKPNFKKKIAATLIDYGLIYSFTGAYISYFGHVSEDGEITVSKLLALPVPGVWFLYFVCVEAYFGATLGHMAFGLRVVSLDRKKISLAQALKRHLLDTVDTLMCGIIGIYVINNSDKKQRLGDKWAGTIVVDMKDPEQF